MSPVSGHKSHAHGHRRSVALFGGTFDPIHAGHIAVAEAAQKRFHLDTVYFVPSSRPPHKAKPALTPFLHRYAMVALACADHADFQPSTAEAPDGATPHVFYTYDTVKKYRREHPDDHLYFIVGADQFLEIPTWKQLRGAARLLRLHHRQPSGISRLTRCGWWCRLKNLGAPSRPIPNAIVLRKSTVHIADHRRQPRLIHRNPPAPGLTQEYPRACAARAVEEYILGQALYR